MSENALAYMVYIYTFFDKNFFPKLLVFSKSFEKLKN